MGRKQNQHKIEIQIFSIYKQMTEIATYDWVCAGCKNKIKKGSEVVQMPYSHKEACKHGGYLYHRRCRPPLITTGEPIIKIEYDENYPEIKIIPCKTIREKNGIACSSRNILLSSKEKNIASGVFKLLSNNKRKIIKKILPLRILKQKIYSLGVNKIDYIKILDINKINMPYKKNKNYKIFIAYFLKSTRLIDNI